MSKKLRYLNLNKLNKKTVKSSSNISLKPYWPSGRFLDFRSEGSSFEPRAPMVFLFENFMCVHLPKMAMENIVRKPVSMIVSGDGLATGNVWNASYDKIFGRATDYPLRHPQGSKCLEIGEDFTRPGDYSSETIFLYP